MYRDEKSSCGVGFIASLMNTRSRDILEQALSALQCVEHRGACSADNVTSDGAGVMTEIPYKLFNYEKHSVAIGTLFLPRNRDSQKRVLEIFQDTFSFLDMEVLQFREIPTDPGVLGRDALTSLPAMIHVVIKRPRYCTTLASFNRLLYTGKQMTQTRLRQQGVIEGVFFPSLSADTIVYKALVRSNDLAKFYLDLQNPDYQTGFALFHRRFSTNTRTSWDRAQPFRIIAHNGEINTIAGNRSWAYSREKSLGLQSEELLTHTGISDSGSLNEMVEALHYRSIIPTITDVLRIMMPPAMSVDSSYAFWARVMEPWDGPAIIIFSDGQSVGARLDRNGFRPGRWARTQTHFYLCSEAGAFNLAESSILAKGALQAGSGVTVDLKTGKVDFHYPSQEQEYKDVSLEPKLLRIPVMDISTMPLSLSKKQLFDYTEEDLNKVLVPMIATGKEAIGSMGDTARIAVLSSEPRAFFDYFSQNFAQVTNPPVDFLRETLATDLTMFLGARANVFVPSELISPAAIITLDSPILGLAQQEFLFRLVSNRSKKYPTAIELSTTFSRAEGMEGFRQSIEKLVYHALSAVERGVSIIILSDRQANFEDLPIPSLLALRAVMNGLNEAGLKLQASLVVHTAEVRNSHQVAALIGFGASAVCPYLALEIARWEPHPKLINLTSDVKESNLKAALASGLLKIMAKMGISVARSYQNAKLFVALGLGKRLIKEYFPGLESPLGGLEIEDIAQNILERAQVAERLVSNGKLINTYQFKEHGRLAVGEKHAMTAARARVVHRLVYEKSPVLSGSEVYEEYLRLGEESEPIHIRNLLTFKYSETPLPIESVQSQEEILRTFGAGGMSFGAISAESQRDLILAMRDIQGRSNSGEGGENPYYFSQGITATTKQVASGRFGVTGEYLITAQELQIKIAQGAKPGEGGQLMSAKITAEIARARHSPQGIDLISPPPLHDIYSIEDLKQLIYELKQLNPDAKVSVKLVSGNNIGTIAVGVAKAGADIIQICGWDGGTGAAGLGSMKHTGLPWELGLLEVHRALVENNLRASIVLRTDGGLHTGKDIVFAAILGAEEFDFGKLLLVAQGCIMARVCETNQCPAGIATHDPKLKNKYQGDKDHVVRMLEYLAYDVQRQLLALGVYTLRELIGRTDLLILEPRHAKLIEQRKLDLSYFLALPTTFEKQESIDRASVSLLNQRLLDDTRQAIETNSDRELFYPITTSDRATLATLAGVLSGRISSYRAKQRSNEISHQPFSSKISVTFTGSAGQGFGVFLVNGLEVRLYGEANDSVGKGMSGGKIVITPAPQAMFKAEENSILGNCVLYGATGGTLFVNGLAGDRFAVRNSGATAVVEGVGLHACEYMTNGIVVILGRFSANLGAGMTGGTVYVLGDHSAEYINQSYIVPAAISIDEYAMLAALLEQYATDTESQHAQEILAAWELTRNGFTKYIPRVISTTKIETHTMENVKNHGQGKSTA
ncbi:MAG: glutamate synthase large subunit [Acidobacteriota bacterium]